MEGRKKVKEANAEHRSVTEKRFFRQRNQNEKAE